MVAAESRAVRYLRRARTWQPFNFVGTRLVRWVGRKTGARQEWAVRHLHPVGPVTARLPNGRTLRLWSRGDDWVGNQVFWRGWRAHEAETAEVFFRIAERAVTTVDVGAYVGYFTLLAAHANPAGRVLAIEALPTVYERLVRNVRLNQLGNVQCVLAAAGAQQGNASFYHQPHALPTSSSLSREFMVGADNLTGTRVSVVTVDDLLRECGISRVDLVKIDTESTEPDVLAGMAAALRRDRPTIVCEVLKDRGAEARLNELMRPLGYRYYLLTADGPVARDVIEGHPEWLNFLLVGRDADVP